MRGLKREFLRVQDGEKLHYGGNQAWDPKKGVQKSACGPVAATDVISFLEGRSQMDRSEFMKKMTRLRRSYFPIVPYLGTHGPGLAFGMNLYFWIHKMPYRAGWGLSAKKRDARIDAMLAQNIPVILCIGNNFPRFWRNAKLTLYRKDYNGFHPYSKTKAHFVIVTGMDESWYRISSWGKELFINRAEFETFAKKDSCAPLSNIIWIKRK
ncbi:MAG: hypothetical protein IJ744_02045 [Lachnospiraceae bacterium]|nr:hypothetical protein [Lachnospiraceae bacterium]